MSTDLTVPVVVVFLSLCAIVFVLCVGIHNFFTQPPRQEGEQSQEEKKS